MGKLEYITRVVHVALVEEDIIKKITMELVNASYIASRDGPESDELEEICERLNPLMGYLQGWKMEVVDEPEDP